MEGGGVLPSGSKFSAIYVGTGNSYAFRKQEKYMTKCKEVRGEVIQPREGNILSIRFDAAHNAFYFYWNGQLYHEVYLDIEKLDVQRVFPTVQISYLTEITIQTCKHFAVLES